MGDCNRDMGCGASSQPKEEASSSAQPAVGGGGAALITPASILADDPADPPKKNGRRKWIKVLPDVFKNEAARFLHDTEIEKVKEISNAARATVPEGRAPKLILMIGAAGTGKSFKQAECFEKFKADNTNVVISDGDDVRSCHAGIQAALNLDKKTLLDALEGAEKEDYTKQLEGVSDDCPIGFEDCSKWVYGKTDKVKIQLQEEGMADKKDMLLALTAIKPQFKPVIDDAVAAGYVIYTAGFVVKPDVLLERQMGRAQKSGRMITVDKSIKNDDLLASTHVKQEKAIQGMQDLLALSEKTGGYGIIFDNTPDFRVEALNNPIYERDGANPPTGDFQGFKPSTEGITVEGMVEFIAAKLNAKPSA